MCRRQNTALQRLQHTKAQLGSYDPYDRAPMSVAFLRVSPRSS
jgi:hypothetical protein